MTMDSKAGLGRTIRNTRYDEGGVGCRGGQGSQGGRFERTKESDLIEIWILDEALKLSA